MSGDALIVLLSGEISSGKSSLTAALVEGHGFARVRTGMFLERIATEHGRKTDRQGLQEMGDILDEETQGDWVPKLAMNQMVEAPDFRYWVLDSVRRDFQINRFRERFAKRALHVHLWAPPDVLKQRYETRQEMDPRDACASYERAKENETERHAATLGDAADVRINSDTITPGTSAAAIAASLDSLSEKEEGAKS